MCMTSKLLSKEIYQIEMGHTVCKEVFLSCYSYYQSFTCRKSKLKYGQKILYPLLTDETAKINILAILLKKIGSSPLKMILYA